LVFLTRQTEFAASHFYRNPAFSPEENARVFGKCSSPNGHGHNYLLQVTVRGDVDPVTGMVLDLKELKEILEREVMDAMDHRFLNHEVPVFATTIPTTENLAMEIWRRLAPRIVKGQLHQVRLYETPDLFVDYYGESHGR
jgi:6-pyruvoyltetrahydropterin/6-carboxytetrahydropterin synthase